MTDTVSNTHVPFSADALEKWREESYEKALAEQDPRFFKDASFDGRYKRHFEDVLLKNNCPLADLNSYYAQPSEEFVKRREGFYAREYGVIKRALDTGFGLTYGKDAPFPLYEAGLAFLGKDGTYLLKADMAAGERNGFDKHFKMIVRKRGLKIQEEPERISWRNMRKLYDIIISGRGLPPFNVISEEKEAFIAGLFNDGNECLVYLSDPVMDIGAQQYFALFSDGRFIVSRKILDEKNFAWEGSFVGLHADNRVILRPEYVPHDWLPTIYARATRKITDAPAKYIEGWREEAYEKALKEQDPRFFKDSFFIDRYKRHLEDILQKNGCLITELNSYYALPSDEFIKRREDLYIREYGIVKRALDTARYGLTQGKDALFPLIQERQAFLGKDGTYLLLEDLLPGENDGFNERFKALVRKKGLKIQEEPERLSWNSMGKLRDIVIYGRGEYPNNIVSAEKEPFISGLLKDGNECLSQSSGPHTYFALFSDGRFIVSRLLLDDLDLAKTEMKRDWVNPDKYVVFKPEYVPHDWIAAIYEALAPTETGTPLPGRDDKKRLLAEKLKQDAKKLKRARGIPHHQALEETAKTTGFDTWKQALQATGEEAEKALLKMKK